ncbi:zinc finger transcription factor [Sporothrix brasiliensis 5110]|uniref:Zinc finger transcription factor n=1 Tax=Sporothrix brasiliensis 5110 TaxID=1398154 RepID=A0A0C2EMX6_9PEZI|nr:zinc finger transcription factor [Sporothrix brasiliensis 5110]KIH87479.1 zinc finger transcription factor [Sporothrix brasiliensis 5110]
MPPRTRTQSSGAMSARSTRSGSSRRSGGSTDASSVDLGASTRASSVSVSASTSGSASGFNSYGSSPTPTEGAPLVPTTTPVDMGLAFGSGYGGASLDALYAPTATYVNLVHMDQMAQYLQAPETQQSLDTLLAVVKVRTGKNGDNDNDDDNTPDYHTALDELDYLEGLFKKLRFSYKEQLTKETVVRRILELELPLLTAADIDRIVQSTEAERQRLRQIKSNGREQGAAAERLVRDLAAEQRYLAMAEAETIRLPDRVLRLRHRLARLKLALRAELDAIDRASSGGGGGGGGGRTVPPAASSYPCTTCGRSFYSEAFHQLHQAMHSLEKGQSASENETNSLVDFGDEAAAAAATSATAMRRCHGCSQMVPALFLDSAPPKGESHKAFHARIQKATAEAHQQLAAASTTSASTSSYALVTDTGNGSRLDLTPHAETEEAVRQLQRSEADLAALEKRVRAEAERQAAIEGEMTQSLQHLRESVGSIRLEMARIEQEADRMVQYIEEGRTYLGRSLQEQTDLFDVLLLGDNDEEADDDGDSDEEMQD